MTGHEASTEVEADDVPSLAEEERPRGWVLKKLKPVHKDICAYVAQGMKLVEAAAICGVTKQYVWMLMQQPLCLAYIREMNIVTEARLEAMFSQTADVIQEGMRAGSVEEQLKAARLQLEVTKRIGAKAGTGAPADNSSDRLLTLADRLVGLLHQQRGRASGEVIEGEFRQSSSLSGNAEAE